MYFYANIYLDATAFNGATSADAFDGAAIPDPFNNPADDNLLYKLVRSAIILVCSFLIHLYVMLIS